MPDTYSFTTDNAALAAKIMALMAGGKPAAAAPAAAPAPVAAAPVTLPAPVTVPVAAPPAPVAPPAPAPVAPPAPAPVAPPAPAPVAAPVAPAAHGPAPQGWTVEHVKSALQALGGNAAKGGPAAVKALLAQFGATKIGDVDPARWPELYAAATAA